MEVNFVSTILRRSRRKALQGSALLGAAAILILALSVFLVRPALAGERLVNAVIAAVDGEALTLFDLRRFGQRRGRLLPQPAQNDADLLEAMLLGRLFAAEFERYGLSAEDEDVDLYIDRLLAERGSSRESVLAALERAGLGWSDYFERMREEVQKLALANREIRTRLNVTPEEVARHWERDPAYERPQGVELAHIFIPLPESPGQEQWKAAAERAEDALALAKREGFAEAAEAYSEGPSAKEGGRLGFFELRSLGADFAETVDGLKEGQISRPFRSGQAFHILMLVRSLPEGRVPLEEVAEDIRAKLYDELLDLRFKRWVDEDLPQRHHVVRRLEKLSGPGGT